LEGALFGPSPDPEPEPEPEPEGDSDDDDDDEDPPSRSVFLCELVDLELERLSVA
jgi:hypothetical protein